MIMSIYTLTDAIVIGKGVGSDALAALSITTLLLCILMAMGILFGVGGSVQMSVHRGTGDFCPGRRFSRSSRRITVRENGSGLRMYFVAFLVRIRGEKICSSTKKNFLKL